MTEIVLNGTEAAVAAGQISTDDAERLKKEAQHAAALELEGEISDVMGRAE